MVADHVGPMRYPAINSAFDALVPAGLQHYWKANFVTQLTDDAIAAHLEHGPKVPAVNSTVHIYPINGACHRVAPDATAFAYRDATFATVIAGMWPDPADNDANSAWVRGFYDATAPHSDAGGYVTPWPATIRSASKTTTRATTTAWSTSSARTTRATCSDTTRTSSRRPARHRSGERGAQAAVNDVDPGGLEVLARTRSPPETAGRAELLATATPVDDPARGSSPRFDLQTPRSAVRAGGFECRLGVGAR